MRRSTADTEQGVQDELRRRLHAAGWRTQKIPGSTLLQGHPDLLCIHRAGRIIYIEVKAPGVKKLRWTQVEWFEKFDQLPNTSSAFYVINNPNALWVTTDGRSNWRNWIPKGKRLAVVVEEWAAEGS